MHALGWARASRGIKGSERGEAADGGKGIPLKVS